MKVNNSKKDFVVILHNIRSAYNVGSILRTADAIGIKKIYLSGYTPSPLDTDKAYATKAQKMIAKTALGAEKSIRCQRARSLAGLFRKLKAEDYQIIALEQDKKSVDYLYFKPIFPLALLLGNELDGVRSRFLKQCDAVIEIPMRGRKNSLNVAVAFGIAGYAITK